MAVWRSDVPLGTLASVMQAAAGNLQMQAVAEGTALPDGSFTGQLLMWQQDELPAGWIPVPDNGSPTARSAGLRNLNDAFPCQLFLGDGTAALQGSTAQLGTTSANLVIQCQQDPDFPELASWQSSFSDGETFTEIRGTTTAVTITANSPGGQISFLSHGVNQTMLDGWQVTLGEGADFVGLDLVVGFIVQVEETLDIALQNQFTQYSLQSGSHVFRNADIGGTPQNNVQFTSLVGAMAAGFLGAAPVVRQSITGATTQDQVDSLVAALVAFGLVSDDR